MRKILFILGLMVSVYANAQIVINVAGNGQGGLGADSVKATLTPLVRPNGIVLDNAGNLYIAEGGNARIRKIKAGTDTITTFAGTGFAGHTGDGGLATLAKLNEPWGMAIDKSNTNLYFTERYNNCVRKINLATNIISLVAGTDSIGFSGDGGLATLATFSGPVGMAIDSNGNLFVADHSNNRIRKIDITTGIITTVAGNGGGYSGDGGLATLARFSSPWDVTFDRNNNMYIGEYGNNCVRKVNASNGIITTVAGVGGSSNYGFSGDGGLAKAALFGGVIGLKVDSLGNLFIVDHNNHRIRKVDVATSIINTVVGMTGAGFNGDSLAPTQSTLFQPHNIFLKNDDIYIADASNQRVRKVTSVLLPLKLLSFSAQKENNNVLLNWQTANEVNVSHINVQRSLNGKDFINIGKVNASCCAYSFVDVQMPKDNSQLYYRLEIVDKDGSKTYSEVRQLAIDNKQMAISIYPNPAKEQVTITCKDAKELLIVDYLGRTIKQCNNPTEHQTLNTKKLKKGIYVIKAILVNGEIKTEKLVVE